jgi:hypothetical protein
VPGEWRGLARAHQGLEKFGTASTIDALVRVPAKGARPRVRGPVWPGPGGMVYWTLTDFLLPVNSGEFFWNSLAWAPIIERAPKEGFSSWRSGLASDGHDMP